MWSLLAAMLVAATPLSGTPGSAWCWPLPPPHEVIGAFAPPAHDWLSGHRGVDLAASPGETVVAAGTGRVVFAGRVADVGVVAIRHEGGLETTYEPVSAGVRRGEPVRAGQRIGTVAGRLAHCARVCLHWGLRRGDVYLDPLDLVGAARVRLLPLYGAGRGDGWLGPAIERPSIGTVGVAAAWAGRTARRRRRISRGRR